MEDPKGEMTEYSERDLFLQEDLSDVTISVTDGEQKWHFCAHSFVLRNRSAVFRSLLGNGCDEKSRHLIVSGFSGVSVKQFLKFLYLDELPETIGDVCVLLNLSSKYSVPSLMSACEAVLLQNINLKNVCHLYNYAFQFSLTSLREKSLALLKRAAFRVIKSDDIENFTLEMLLPLVSADDLNVDEESDVFWAIRRWTRFGLCKINATLEELPDLLQHVRWNLVVMKEMEKIQKTGVSIPEQKTTKPSRTQSCFPSLIPFADSFDLSSVRNSFEKDIVTCQLDDLMISFVSDECVPLYITAVLLALNVTNRVTELAFILHNEETGKTAEVVRNTFRQQDGRSTYQEVYLEFKKPLKLGKNERVVGRYDSHGAGAVEMTCLELKSDLVVSGRGGKKIISLQRSVFGLRKIFFL